MKRKLIIITTTSLALLASCTDAQKAKIGGLNNEFKIEFWSGGEMVKDWTSTGKVRSQSESDGYYFLCKDTRKLIEVSGDLVITQL